jgi:peptide/nickel transport system permease protein
VQAYILQRLLLAVPTFLGAVLLVFVLLRLLPGDVVSVLVFGGEGPSPATQEQIHRLREELGLTRPLHVQFWDWLTRAVRFDFGASLWTGQPITRELLLRYPVTLSLLLVSVTVSVAIALPAGVVMALRQDTWVDYALRLLTLAGLSVPNFFMAILLLLALALLLDWSPPLEYRPLWEDPWLNIQRLLLPAVVAGYRLSAVGARMVRASLLEVLGEDYIRTARAKGLGEALVVSRHALKNALLPVVTLIGFEVISLIGGVVVVETVFTIPGVGRFLVDAVFHRDYPSVQAVVFVIALVVLVVNLVVDLLYAWLDPRIRYR